MKIEVEEKRCLAYGNCVAVAPDVYELESSVATVLLPDPPDELHEAARHGAEMCPVAAIKITE